MTTHAQIIDRFAGEAGKDSPRMIGSDRQNVYVSRDGQTLYSYGSHFPMAIIRPEGKTARGWWLVNGDNYSVTTSRHQSMTRGALASTGLPMLILPFSALRTADIDRDTITPLEISPERNERTSHYAATLEEVPEKYRGLAHTRGHEWGCDGCTGDGRYHWETYRHWLGASVFRAKYRSGYTSTGNGLSRPRWTWATFLSAFDENEPRPLYFLAQLPGGSKVTTIAEALEALKPPAVTEAEAAGLTVLRQGDVFAVPAEFTTRQARALAADGEIHRRVRVLQVSHAATESVLTTDGTTLARGILRHRPGGWRQPDHRNVKLGDGKTWHRLIKNTVPVDDRGESRSWSMGGNVD